MSRPTRRGILSAMTIAPIVIAAPAAAVAYSPIERAWADWRSALTALDSASTADVANADSPIWNEVKRSAAIIETSQEKGRRAAEIRLWYSLTYNMILIAEVDAIYREDIEWLIANAEDVEFPDKMAMQAIRSLRA